MDISDWLTLLIQVGSLLIAAWIFVWKMGSKLDGVTIELKATKEEMSKMRLDLNENTKQQANHNALIARLDERTNIIMQQQQHPPTGHSKL